jgi:hypothetical protein
VGSLVLAGWYVSIGASSIQKSTYQNEVKARQADFVAYKGMPNVNSVTGQSDALTANASVVKIDLHSCSPGAAKVSYAGGTTHFAFSGVTKDESLDGLNYSDCIFYVGKEVASQPWDGLLSAKCTWLISDTLAENRLEFPITNDGIQFGDFPGNCQDLKTGVAPDL